jgi:hypothetical protein
MNRNYLASAIGLLFACAVGAVAAQAAGPAADYNIDPEHTSTSPDGATTVEQYARISADGDYTWQFWARHQDKLTLLKPEQPDYAAGFRFTSDSQWLVRMQKTGAGYASLYLYHLGPQGFVAATAKPLSDLAWAYFRRRPDFRKIRKPDFHIEAGLVKGTDDNYRHVRRAAGFCRGQCESYCSRAVKKECLMTRPLDERVMQIWRRTYHGQLPKSRPPLNC